MRAVVVAVVAVLLAGLAVAGVGGGPRAAAEYASGGSGLHKGLIDWFEWGADGTAIGSGATRTNTRAIAGEELATTCRISDVVGAVRTYRPGNWRGDALDDLYNVGGTGTANQLVSGLANTDQGTTVSFHFACSVTLDGLPVPLAGLVVADAEASNTNEYLQATPDQPATWRVIDRDREGCATSTVATRSADNTLRFAPDGAECSNLGAGRGPMAVGFMEGATSARIALKGGGRSAVALGVVLGADFGDAPESYGQAGALLSAPWSGGEVPVGSTPVSSGFALGTPGLPVPRLGATVDAEGGQIYSPGATGDDTTDVADEDAVTPPEVRVTPGQDYTLPGVACTGAGFVAGWLDWNRDGVFGAGERSTTVPCAGGAVALMWTVPADARDARGTDTTFLRMRIAADAAGAAEPAGLATSGEVEDHAVHVVLPRLRLAKTSDATADTRPGDLVRYTVTATNTETTDFTAAYPAVVVDDLTGVLDDATYGDDASADRPGEPGYRAPRLTWAGPLAAGDSVTITYTVRIGDRTGDGTVRNVVWAPEDPDDPGDAPACDPPGADGLDPATGVPCAEHEYPLPSLSVTKSASRADLPAVGDRVTFTITVRNEGPGAYTATAPARMTDDLTEVLDDATIDTASITASTGTATYDAPHVDWSGALAPGASATVEYTVTYTGEGDHELVNTACVPEQETAPTFSSCDVATVPGARLTRWKDATASSDPVVAGSTITYTLHFRNDGKARAVVDAVDDLTHVLDDADVTVEPASPDGLTAERTGPRIAITGTVPAGATRTVTYTVTVRPDGARGDDTIANFLLDPDATPPPTPVCDPRDPDVPECTTTPVAAVTVTKSVSASTDPVDTGTVLTYTVTVRSTGTAPTPVTVDDDLSGVLDDATFGTGPDSDTGTVTVTGPDGNVLRIRGTLAGGATATITYTVTVNGPDRRGDNRVGNFLVTPGGTPPEECAEDDPACTVTPLANVTVTKSADPASGTTVAAGDEVTYTLEFANTGTAPTAVDRTDHLADVLDDADLTAGPETSDPALTATRDGTTIRVTGTLAPGASARVTYTVTVRPDDARGDHLLGNVVVRTGERPPGTCLPGNPACTAHPAGYLRAAKTVTPPSGSTVSPGDLVTYTLSFHNTGPGPAKVDHTDHLADVLDNADLTGAPTASPGLHVTGQDHGVLRVTGTVASGATGTVTYAVTVHSGGRLTNHLTVTGATPPVTCRPGSPLCTDNPVSAPPPLAHTGTPALGLITTALWVLLAGIWLLAAARRRALR